MEPGLPFLPGYTVNTSVRKNFPLNHNCDVINGIRVTDQRSPFPETHSSITPPAGEAPSMSEKRRVSISVSSDDTTRIPHWVLYDRQVLKFEAYCTEAVNNSRDETTRCRKFLIYFYLEDFSMHIHELRQENSGIPQGIFLKRHKIAKKDGNYIGLEDLRIGAVLRIYERDFTLVDVDKHTRDFFKEKRNVELKPALPYPSDSYTSKLNFSKQRKHGGSSEIRLFVEASLGKPMKDQLEKTRQFLTNDRKVLLFDCQWDDVSLYGQKRDGYKLHYFLADNTVEILEPHEKNSGRDAFPTLLRRMKLPKALNPMGTGSIGGINSEFYLPEDLAVGKIINVFKRPFKLTKADAYTKNYYIKHYGRTEKDFIPIDTSRPPAKVIRSQPPPYNGYGTEDDSLGSCKSLVPKPPRKDYKKLLENDKKVLRFLAKFVKPTPEDVNRRFVINFHLADDTISIFEQWVRNSGFVGGKFLERSKLRNPQNGNAFFTPQDFEVGKVAVVNRHAFHVVEVDKATKTLLEESGNLPAPAIGTITD